MKQTGPHREKILTAVAVRNTATPGFYPDGQGLYLKVTKTGGKSWIQRIVIDHKRRDIGLGSVSLVSLAEARQKAIENRRAVRTGGNPLAQKRQVSEILTFEQSARTVYEIHKPTWSNPKQAQQWINTLETYAFPVIGSNRVDRITSKDVLTVLSPIWVDKHETASRVRQRIGTVLNWCKGQGWIQENVADNIQASLPRIKKRDRVKHHKSLPYRDVSGAIRTIKDSGAGLSTVLALEFLILTASRSGEVRNAMWEEIDLDAMVWTVPAERMKKRKIHKVPLSPRCVEILKDAEKLQDGAGYVFPGTKLGKPLSDATLSKLLRDLGIECVPHGFRSSFRQWAAEMTNIPREVAEFALAHVVGDSAEQAYQRSDLFEKRRKLMDSWAQYIDTNSAKVVRLRSNVNRIDRK